MARALFLGAGDLGTQAAMALVRDGWQVHALRRRVELLPAPLLAVQADITDRAACAALVLPVVDALVVCLTAGASTEPAYRSIYVEGVRNVLDALEDQQRLSPRIVFVSTTAVYAQHDGSVVDEMSATAPTRFNGAVMLDAESQIASSGSPTTVIARLGGIYGAGRTRLLERVRNAQEPVGPGMRDAHTNRIHADDAAEAIGFLVAHPSPPAVVNVVDDEPARRSDVVRFLAAELGVPLPLADATAAEASESPASRRDDKRVSNARLRALGFALRYPTYREGYRSVLRGA